MAEIPLTRGLVAIVDDEDLDLVRRHSWHAHAVIGKGGRRCGWYAATTTECSSGRATTVYMHRLILQPTGHALADHRDGDGLNNRRRNLRPASHSQNLTNRRTTATSGFRGVEMPERENRRLRAPHKTTRRQKFRGRN